MSTDKTGGPAFPAHHFDLADGEHGITVRDYFAAKAMAAFICSPRATQEWLQQHLVATAWGVADAMLKEREGKQ